MFITLEGGEGSGKTTQTKLLTQFLQGLGHQVVQTHEPGGTVIGQKIREILLDTKNFRIYALTELLLYQADRAQHLEEIVKPALTEGKVVVCDRFYDATVAYQGFGRGIDKGLIYRLNLLTCSQLKPDLTLILDLDVRQGLSRAITAAGKADRIEMERLEFHERVRQGYLRIAKEEPDRVKIIDGSKGIEEVHQIICSLIMANIKTKENQRMPKSPSN